MVNGGVGTQVFQITACGYSECVSEDGIYFKCSWLGKPTLEDKHFQVISRSQRFAIEFFMRNLRRRTIAAFLKLWLNLYREHILFVVWLRLLRNRKSHPQMIDLEWKVPLLYTQMLNACKIFIIKLCFPQLIRSTNDHRMRLRLSNCKSTHSNNIITWKGCALVTL